MTNVEVSFLKYKWDKMSDTDKEPYVIKGKESDPIQDQVPAEINKNTAKPDLSDQAEEKRIKAEVKRIESLARTIYIEEERTFDYSKKRATDMKQNTEVKLPGALGLEAEAGLEVLRQEWRASYREFCTSNCNKKKDQVSNLNKQEKEGLESLRKRVSSGELIVVPTDKSGRFSVMDVETYMLAGLKHTKKDEKISIHQIRENQSELNGQVSMILKIFRVGKTWGHTDRARGNMITNSEMVSSMYLMFKDHKGWHWGLGTDPPSRPIASGNSGQNVHMSELTSELLESVVTAYHGGVEIISTEDMLAKWDDLNKKNENWHGGTWWDGYEEDGLITCGNCLGEDDDIPDLCCCQGCEKDQQDGNIYEGRKIIEAGDITNDISGLTNSLEENLIQPGGSTDNLDNLEQELIQEGREEPGEERHARAPGCTQDVNTEQETVPDGWKPRNRIEDFVKKKKSGEIPGQKMKITVKYMKERRRRKWERDFKWLEKDLDRLIESTEANPEDLQDFSLPMVLIGSDVASLYPSLDAVKVAELVYQAVLKSDIKWSNIDYIEAIRYIAMNWTEE